MPKISSEKLLATVKKSGLVAEDDLARTLASLAVLSPGGLPSNPHDIIDLLVNEKLVNRWQADNLLKGKYKGFFLGKYRLLGHLGKGGMSQVYLAEHSVMERLVAIKVLPSRYVENPNYLDRFKREARAVAALDHPNIVRAYDIDQDGKTHYIVMEYVDGRDLQRIVAEDGILASDDAADYIAQAALGLQHAHEAGLVHRDVKPANCLVDNRRTLRLLDMGLAKFSQDHHPSLSEIHDDSVVGTADYLAPEQARNSQTVDARADIYGLGCTLYFALVGAPPFPDGSIAQRLLKHQNEQPPSIFEKRPDAPRSLVDLCERMMRKSPDQRIQTAADVASELRTWLGTRGKALSAVYTEAGSAANQNQSSGDSDGGWKRATRIGTPSPSSKIQNDTVPVASSDTTSNDDLTLAPLDDDPTATDPDSGSLISGSSVHSKERSSKKEKRGEDTSSGIFDTASAPVIDSYESGPLDAILDDPSFVGGPQLPKRQLKTIRSKKDRPNLAILGGGIAAALLIVVVILIVILVN